MPFALFYDIVFRFKSIRTGVRQDMSLSENIDTTAFKRHETDTGSSEVTVAQWTNTIKKLTIHLRKSPKDFSARRGLTIAISRRRKALDYLKKTNHALYAQLIESLNIRR